MVRSVVSIQIFVQALKQIEGEILKYWALFVVILISLLR